MKRFLAVYTGTAASRKASGWEELAPEERAAREAAGMQAWGEWMAAHGAAIVDGGGPLGKTRRASRDGLADAANNLAAFVIVEAETLEAAAAMFDGHPHFSIFPGDGVEVMECLPVPGEGATDVE